MKKLSAIFFACLLTLPLISACTPGEINSAIEACKGDPECYEIIDEALDTELASRGITGGRMTNFELAAVQQFLRGYTFGEEEDQFNSYKNYYIFLQTFALDNGGYEKWNQFAGTLDWTTNLDQNEVGEHEFFELDKVGFINKQIVFLEIDPILTYKALIYKTGEDVFKYELYLNQFFDLTVDLKLKSIFCGEERYPSPVNYFNYLKENNSLLDLYGEGFVFNSDSLSGEKKVVENAFGIFSITQYTNPMVGAEIYYFPLNKNYNYYLYALLRTTDLGKQIVVDVLKHNMGETQLSVSCESPVDENYQPSEMTIGYFLDSSLGNEEIASSFTLNLGETSLSDFTEEIYAAFSPFLNETLIV